MKEFEELGWAWKALGYLCACVFAIITAFLCANVIARFFFNAPYSWIPEVSRHLMIWLTFLASALALRMQAHLKLDILTNIRNKQIEQVINIGAMLLVIAFSGVLVYYGWDLVERVARQRSSALGYSMSYPYAAIPTGSILFIIAALMNILDYLPHFSRKAASR